MATKRKKTFRRSRGPSRIPKKLRSAKKAATSSPLKPKASKPKPKASKPKASKPASRPKPKASKPKASKPASRPKPKASKPVPKPKASKPKASKPVSKPKASKPVSKPKASKPVSKPKASKSKASKPASKPKASKPKASKPKASKPKASKPKASKPLEKLSRKQLLKKLRETEKKLIEVAVEKGERLTFRDKKGRYVNPAVWQKEQAKKRVEKAYEKVIRKERLGASRKYPIPPNLRRRLDRILGRMSLAASDEAKLQPEIDAPVLIDSRWEGGFALTGLPDTGDLEQDFEDGSDLARDAILTSTEKLPLLKGLMVSVSLVPEESVLLVYGRNRPFMNTNWRRADSPAERNTLYPAVRGMMEVMARNKWKIVGVRFHFYYDRRIALKGKIAKR